MNVRPFASGFASICVDNMLVIQKGQLFLQTYRVLTTITALGVLWLDEIKSL